IDKAGAESIAKLAARFPEVAKHTDPGSLMEPMDRSVAQDTLEALQTRHNAELASLEALRGEAASARAAAAAAAAGLVLQRGEPGSAAPDGSAPSSLKDRAKGLWRRFGGT